MSQSRFSIVLVGVSALLRRPLVSRLRPADGERSSWVVFAARGCRFDSGFRWAGWPSGSLLPLFGTHRFGVAAGRVRSSAFRFGVAVRRVGLRAHCFRFSARTASEWLLGEFVLPPSVSEWPSAGWPSGSPLPLFGLHRFGVAAGRVRSSAFRFGNCPRRVGSSAGRVGLRARRFRFSACAASEWPLGEFVLPPSVSELPFGGLAFGLTASAFRHAPFRSGRWASSFFRLPFRSCRSAGWPSGSLLPLFGMRRFGVAAGRVRSSTFRFGNCPRRVGLRAHCFRFSACTASELPLGELVLPLSGLAFGLTVSAFRPAPIRSGRWASSFFRLPLRRFPLGGLAFGLTASAFRPAPIRRLLSAGSFFRLPLRRFRSTGWFFRSAGWPSGSPLPLFGTHRSAPPHRRREGRRSTPTRHLFHFKTLIPTC